MKPTTLAGIELSGYVSMLIMLSTADEVTRQRMIDRVNSLIERAESAGRKEGRSGK